MSDAPSPETLRAEILRMVHERGAGKTVCPSEVARSLAGSDEKVWRLLMQPIRRVAAALSDEGLVVIRRKGRPVAPADLKGIYRLSPPEGD
ncbi:DUF3253 domain-containing protein [Aureimonas flava]|uniref:DUF3253 domain-containing protein n=1 Tax=Aureimonas flava TaxID=2320271 RepID=A0A3A1WME3_9HYPH|nr:DUF3253 domain-containing protein [Aureimonas flava]RIY01548.1 DUF3253 domain-containing protein [Aureimonas flava]